MWSRYSDGHAMMGGGFRLSSGDLKLVLHALKTVLWNLDRSKAA
jgi:hypothetical protein